MKVSEVEQCSDNITMITTAWYIHGNVGKPLKLVLAHQMCSVLLYRKTAASTNLFDYVQACYAIPIW